MKAADIMSTPVVSVGPGRSVRDIAKRMIESRVSAVPVVDTDGRVIGIVSEGDLMRRAESGTERHPSWWLGLLAGAESKAHEYVKSHGLTAADVMTRNVLSVAEDTPIAEIAALLEKNRIKRVPVLRDGKVVGIVSRANLMHGLVTVATSPAPSASDQEIRVALDNAFKAAGVQQTFLNALVSGGVVQLWGAVETDDEKRAARIAAESTAGVKRVVDNLGVFPPTVRAVLWAE